MYNINEQHDIIIRELKSFMAGTGFNKVVIGLSGGIDSSLTACLAVEALGKDNVIGISMPSRYSSEGSITDALVLAKNLDIIIHQICIEDIHRHARMSIRQEGLKCHGVADENLQARIRGMILMTYSNQYNALVLNTGNKTEAYLGYCTIYGDTCGAIGVLGDLLKRDVYEMSNTIYDDVIPKETLTKPPSAELSLDQTDEQSLLPYKILDDVVERYVELEDSKETIISYHKGYDVLEILNKIDKSVFKRQQCPPIIKVRSLCNSESIILQ